MRSLIFLLLAAFYLTSCTIPLVSGPSSPAPTQSLPTQADFETHEIDQLLTLAEQALQKQRLTTPVDDNAYLRYLQVLARDPKNPYALAGIARIVETYISWAVDAMDRDLYTRAANMLTKAGSVDEDHPALKPLWTRLETAREREKSLIRISQNDLQQRTSALAEQLGDIAAGAGPNVIVKIRAPSDADARWIYQQLNAGTESRLRATISTGLAPSVQLSHP